MVKAFIAGFGLAVVGMLGIYNLAAQDTPPPPTEQPQNSPVTPPALQAVPTQAVQPPEVADAPVRSVPKSIVTTPPTRQGKSNGRPQRPAPATTTPQPLPPTPFTTDAVGPTPDVGPALNSFDALSQRLEKIKEQNWQLDEEGKKIVEQMKKIIQDQTDKLKELGHDVQGPANVPPPLGPIGTTP